MKKKVIIRCTVAEGTVRQMLCGMKETCMCTDLKGREGDEESQGARVCDEAEIGEDIPCEALLVLFRSYFY
jgi:hypothetical protein